MANYISANANRFYAAVEHVYGVAAPAGPANRLPIVAFDCHQVMQASRRRDKTGTRTYLGSAPTAARTSRFALTADLTSWDGVTAPYSGSMIAAAMGAGPALTQGLIVQAVSGVQIQTETPHNLSAGATLASGGEIRFVTSAPDILTININAPFSMSPSDGMAFTTTCSYRLATQVPSLTLYDYWDPSTAVSRLVTGAGVDTFQVDVKGDVHEMHFDGPAADVIDSTSGSFGLSGLETFPAEPAVSALNYSIVPGSLGQVWLGAPLSQVFTLTTATVVLKNNLLTRDREFGSAYPRAIAPTAREVLIKFTLFAQSDGASRALYAAAKNRTSISAMLQLGRQTGRIMGIYLPSVVPELPRYQDSQLDLLWEFKNNDAQGVLNDELYVAFA